MLDWLMFAGCVALIGVAGVRLSRYGDVVAEKTGLGGGWIGLIMLASVTSLPELVTGVTAVTVAQVPDIAVGDVLGSCVFNLLIIVLLDFLQREESVYFRASRGHILSAAFGIMLIGIAGFSVLADASGMQWRLGHIGLYSPAIVVVYVIAIRTVFRYEKRKIEEFTAEMAAEVTERYPDMTLPAAVRGYIIAALVVVAAGVALPYVAERLAEQMGWSHSFVGTIFVAFATSLPEIVTTIAAFRLGALDMAIGNLFGSNLFNIAILAVDDVFYLKGPLLSHVSANHAMSALSAIIMTGVAVAGILYRPRTSPVATVGWASIALFVVYLLNSYVLFLLAD